MLSNWPVERPADWVEFVNEPQTVEELEALRRSVNRGCPFGDDQWRDQMVKKEKEDEKRRFFRTICG